MGPKSGWQPGAADLARCGHRTADRGGQAGVADERIMKPGA